MMRTSFLTLGGYSTSDFTGNISWFDNIDGAGWNQTITEVKYNDKSIIESTDNATVMVETGYPYIGFSESYFDKITKILENENSRIECQKGEHYGLCMAKVDDCDILRLDYNLTIVINEVDFIIPLKNMAVITSFRGSEKTC